MVFQPQLYRFINWCMHSFSVFKILVPIIKQKYNQHNTVNLSSIYQHLPPTARNDRQPVQYPISGPKIIPLIDPRFKIPFEELEEKQQDEEETNKSTCSFPQSDHQLQKNMIANRVRSMQYEANNPCEDTLSFEQLKALDAYVISVFDGHGGPELAQYSRSKIHSLIDSYLTERLVEFSSVGEAIKESLRWAYQRIEDAFFETYEQQLRMGNKRIRSVGTCAITALVHNDIVYLANSGDSQAIFLYNSGQGVLSIKANDRLSVNSRSERERLRKQWADADEEIVTEEGGAYYLKGRLQPTRTIGDYYLKKEVHYQGPGEFKGPYLTCIPDITEHKITSAHRYLVIASDGVWDSLSKNQVAEILLREREIDLSKTCYDLQEEEPPYLSSVVGSILERASDISGLSVQQLKGLSQGHRRNYHDDITLVVVDLQQQS